MYRDDKLHIQRVIKVRPVQCVDFVVVSIHTELLVLNEKTLSNANVIQRKFIFNTF